MVIDKVRKCAENQSGFDYSSGGRMGPERWGDLKEEWAACKTGRLQSPIDMSSLRVRLVFKSGDIKRSYKPSDASVMNRGHDISVRNVLYYYINHVFVFSYDYVMNADKMVE